MNARNFGITKVQAAPGGFRQPPARRADTPRDLPPLPRGSIQSDPLTTDAERNSAAGKFVVVFLSLWFLVPLILAGIMMRGR